MFTTDFWKHGAEQRWWTGGEAREVWMMGCERRVGRRCGVNYFKNKLLSVSGLFFHFLYCLGSCFPGILPAWRYSLRPLMKYSPRLWADMRKVTWKVKRTNHGRRLGDGKFSYQTELFKGWARLNLETVAWRLPVEISQDLQNTVWWDELSTSGGGGATEFFST